MRKTTVLFAAFAFSASLSGCAVENEAAAPFPNRETATVASGSVSVSDARVGYVEPVEKVSVSAKSAGRLVSLSVEKGDRVKAGQILATLDSAEAKESVRSAGNALSSTELVYGDTSALYDAQIAAMNEKANQAKKGIELAEAALKGADTGLSDAKAVAAEQLASAEKQVELAKLWLEASKTQLANTSALFDQKRADAYSNGRDAVASTQILAENLFSFVDEAFGVSDANRNKNDAFEAYLGAKNASSKVRAESLYASSYADFLRWKSEISGYPSNTDSEADAERAYALLKRSEGLLEELRTLSKAAYDAFDATVASSALDDSGIASYKARATGFRDSVEKALLSVSGNYVVGVRGARQSVDTLKNEKSLQLSMLSKQVDLAEKQLEAAKQSSAQYRAAASGQVNDVSTKNEIARKQLDIAEQQYREALSGIEALKKQKSAQLSGIGAQLAGIRGNRDLASVQLGNGTVVAPFDGVVVEKAASMGQVVSPGMPILVLAKDDVVKVRVYLPESEAASVKPGDAAEISFSANSTGAVAEASLVDPAADPTTKKVGVEFRLPNKDGKIFLGSTASVRFAGKSLSGKTVPYRFLEYSFGRPVLSALRGGSVTKVPVTLAGCSSSACVFEGEIREGETVVVP